MSNNKVELSSTVTVDGVTYKRSIQGIGYNSGGIHIATMGKRDLPDYVAFSRMLSRAYSSHTHKAYPTYQECSVAPEWHDFQNFGDWLATQYKPKNNPELDKDLLVENNKIYSPSTCLYISGKINSLFLQRSGNNTGVGRSKSGKFTAVLNHKHLGSYSTQVEARLKYLEAKLSYAKLVLRTELDACIDDGCPDWYVEKFTKLGKVQLSILIREMGECKLWIASIGVETT